MNKITDLAEAIAYVLTKIVVAAFISGIFITSMALLVEFYRYLRSV